MTVGAAPYRHLKPPMPEMGERPPLLLVHEPLRVMIKKLGLTARR